MIGLLAVVRPDDQNIRLFVHVLGAMILVGGLLSAAGLLGLSRGDVRYLRLGYWTLLAVALPGWIVMRIGAQLIYTEEGWDKLPDTIDKPAWLGIGELVADLGALIMLVSLVVGGIGVYRLREGKGAGLLRTTLVLSIVMLAAYLVAVWAMAGKPN
jgi:hypothetical protein